MNKKTVGLIFGGKSGEHEVSLQSAAAIGAALDCEKYELIPILISREGVWYGPIPVEDIATATAERYQGKEIALLPKPGGVLWDLHEGKQLTKLDLVFPIVHGTYGEDGILQGLLELAELPYVGAGVAGSAIGMDKVLMREILAYHHIPQVAFLGLQSKEVFANRDKCCEKCEAVLRYPMFVKPANGGSSVGISKAHSREELESALVFAARFDRKLMIEQGVTVREIETAVLGNWDNSQVAMPGEIISSNEFYDYNAKYIDNRSVAKIPADLTESQQETIRNMALDVYRILDCECMARIDFFLEEQTGRILLNEINTLPGFTAISMYPKMMTYGEQFDMTGLLSRLLELAEEKYHDRSQVLVQWK